MTPEFRCSYRRSPAARKIGFGVVTSAVQAKRKRRPTSESPHERPETSVYAALRGMTSHRKQGANSQCRRVSPGNET